MCARPSRLGSSSRPAWRRRPHDHQSFIPDPLRVALASSRRYHPIALKAIAVRLVTGSVGLLSRRAGVLRQSGGSGAGTRHADRRRATRGRNPRLRPLEGGVASRARSRGIADRAGGGDHRVHRGTTIDSPAMRWRRSVSVSVSSIAAALVNLLSGPGAAVRPRSTNRSRWKRTRNTPLADVWTSVGVVGGVGAVALTGWQRLDPIVALAVATISCGPASASCANRCAA